MHEHLPVQLMLCLLVVGKESIFVAVVAEQFGCSWVAEICLVGYFPHYIETVQNIAIGSSLLLPFLTHHNGSPTFILSRPVQSSTLLCSYLSTLLFFKVFHFYFTEAHVDNVILCMCVFTQLPLIPIDKNQFCLIARCKSWHKAKQNSIITATAQ